MAIATRSKSAPDLAGAARKSEAAKEGLDAKPLRRGGSFRDGCRYPGSKAGSFKRMEFSHTCFHDPYERANFWSHFAPGLVFIFLGYLGQTWEARMYGLCAAGTHLFSALAHAYPDDHQLEKLDHLGIIMLVIGTPGTMALRHDLENVSLNMVYGVLCTMVVAAFLPPLPRVISFGSGVGSLALKHANVLVQPVVQLEITMYICVAVLFLRNKGHYRPEGLSDHHIAHYVVTAACSMHMWHLWHPLANFGSMND